MKKQKVKSRIDLEMLAGGAFHEKVNEALATVAENIQNPNTDASAKREITIKIKFAPSKNRQVVSTNIQVTTKLAATEAIETEMIMGMDARTGEIEISEYGQVSFDDYAKRGENTDETPVPKAEQAQAPTQKDGKPLDLRNRSKKQEEEPPALVAGRDYDPDTGEVYETGGGQPAENNAATNGQVVPFIKKAAQA